MITSSPLIAITRTLLLAARAPMRAWRSFLERKPVVREAWAVRMNCREVRDKSAGIVNSIRKEPHPAFVEIRTYRYRGHSMSDPASYRTKQELEKYRLDDPISRLRAQLTREGKLTNEQFDQIDKHAKETVLASVRFAEKSPQLPLDKLYDYTYANGAKP